MPDADEHKGGRIEDYALLELALNSAIDLIDGSDAELLEAVRRCIDLAKYRRFNTPMADHQSTDASTLDVLANVQIIHTAISINPGTGSELSGPRGKPSPRPHESETERRVPKLEMVLHTLATMGVRQSQIRAYVGTDDSRANQGPNYTLLEVSGSEVDIAVCNELGHSTFVSAGNKGADYWHERTKQELLDTVGIFSVLYRTEEQFKRRVSEAFRECVERPCNQLPSTIVERPSEYDPRLIEECIEAHWNAEGKMPVQNSGEIKFGPYANGKTTWKAIAMFLLKAKSKQAHDGILTTVPTLIELTRNVAERLDIYDPYVFRDIPLNPADIEETIISYYKSTGTWPTITPDPVDVGPYRNMISWSTIDDALRRGNRGLSGGSSLVAIREEIRTRLAKPKA